MAATPSDQSSFAERFSNGTESAFFEADARFREPLMRWVKNNLGQKFGGCITEESILLAAEESAFRFVRDPSREKRFRHAGDVWAWLLFKTKRALQRRIERELAIIRPPASRRISADEIVLFDRKPSPDDKFVTQDLADKLVEGLGSPYPEIVALLLLGHTQCEIADTLNVGREYVKGKIKRLRERLAVLLRQCEHPSM